MPTYAFNYRFDEGCTGEDATGVSLEAYRYLELVP